MRPVWLIEEGVFTGRCIDKDDFAQALSPATFDADCQVVIAAPREIGREWRVVVAGDEVVAASQYADEGTLREVRWRPDPIFRLDVCESAGSCGWSYRRPGSWPRLSRW